MVMHGAGDVVVPNKSNVNMDSAKLISELTATYISSLVHAAIDSHQILNNGPLPLPPPPPQLASDHRKAPKPVPYSPPGPKLAPGSAAAVFKSLEPKRKRQRRATDEFWDDPLPEPKIRNRKSPSKDASESHLIENWCGVAGVDFWETSRSRKAHVAGAIGAQCFIFPICHDVGLYGKVLEVQSSRRSIEPLLVDPAIMEVVRAEGSSHGVGTLRKRDKPATTEAEATSQQEETDSEGEDEATWPGLEYLLPYHVTRDMQK